jgi:hypothetical protein
MYAWNASVVLYMCFLKLYDLFHILQSFWLTLDPWTVMYVCMYATSRKVAGLGPDEVTGFFQLT